MAQFIFIPRLAPKRGTMTSPIDRTERHLPPRQIGTTSFFSSRSDVVAAEDCIGRYRQAIRYQDPLGDIRVEVDEKYEVIIRPSSPPFMSWVLREPTSLSAAPTQACARPQVCRNAPTALQRAQQLLPSVTGSGPLDEPGLITVKTTPRAQNEIAQSFAFDASSHRKALLELGAHDLNRLWDMDSDHTSFVHFIGRLRACPNVPVWWTEGSRRVRTLRPSWRLPLARTLKGCDPGSFAPALSNGLIWFKGTELGYTKTDAASVLAISRLAANDSDNFCKIVTVCPAVINDLLDSKKISHGPIFKKETIWSIIAHSTVRFVDLSDPGKDLSSEPKPLTLAFENFLKYYNPFSKRSPYVAPSNDVHLHIDDRADVLANHADDFFEFVESLLPGLDSQSSSPQDVGNENLHVGMPRKALATSMVNTIFVGIDYHLDQVHKRRMAYNKSIERYVDTGGAYLLDTEKGGRINKNLGAPSKTWNPLTRTLMDGHLGQADNMVLSSDFSDMRHLYRTLHKNLKARIFASNGQ